ncbi:P27 family phage terminase small subunit [Bradyrhizobium sp. ORS 111]|uniref:P27 family phage terminase small subunit n=1 Tax=Bradyrhizobium sp. ORS 111 TaxID=1685958 RepID=UPI00388E04A6
MPGPPHLRLLKGNTGKRRGRIPPEPTRTEECPEPPHHLRGYTREAWCELAPELHRLNLLTTLDLGPFSVYCAAYSTWRQLSRLLHVGLVLRDARSALLRGDG